MEIDSFRIKIIFYHGIQVMKTQFAVKVLERIETHKSVLRIILMYNIRLYSMDLFA